MVRQTARIQRRIPHGGNHIPQTEFVWGKCDGGKRGWAMRALRDHAENETEFACRACGSPAVVYPDRLSDDAPVKCQRCRTVLCTLREFRLSAEQGMA